MAIIECKNGHLYDNALHTVCPYCNGGIYRVDFGSSPEEIGATVLLEEEPAGSPGLTPGGREYEETLTGFSDASKPAGSPGLMPGGRFAGRLVCTEGPDEGKTIILEPGKTVDISSGRYVYLS